MIEPQQISFPPNQDYDYSMVHSSNVTGSSIESSYNSLDDESYILKTNNSVSSRLFFFSFNLNSLFQPGQAIDTRAMDISKKSINQNYSSTWLKNVITFY